MCCALLLLRDGVAYNYLYLLFGSDRRVGKVNFTFGGNMSSPVEACSTNLFRINVNACKQEIEDALPTLPPTLDSRSDIFSGLTAEEKKEAIEATAEQDKRLEAAANCLNQICDGKSCKYDRAAMEKLGIFRLNVDSYASIVNIKKETLIEFAAQISSSLDLVARISHIQNDPQLYYDLASDFMQTTTDKLADVLQHPAKYKIPGEYLLKPKKGEGCETYNLFATALTLTYYLKGKEAADKLMKLAQYQ